MAVPDTSLPAPDSAPHPGICETLRGEINGLRKRLEGDNSGWPPEPSREDHRMSGSYRSVRRWQATSEGMPDHVSKAVVAQRRGGLPPSAIRPRSLPSGTRRHPGLNCGVAGNRARPKEADVQHAPGNWMQGSLLLRRTKNSNKNFYQSLRYGNYSTGWLCCHCCSTGSFADHWIHFWHTHACPPHPGSRASLLAIVVLSAEAGS